MELDEVLMLSRNGQVSLGSPTVPGAKVVAEAVTHGRGPKVIVFKYKPKTRYRRKNGHRQGYTDLKVTGILVEEGAEEQADGWLGELEGALSQETRRAQTRPLRPAIARVLASPRLHRDLSEIFYTLRG